jgi:hypothetical protein
MTDLDGCSSFVIGCRRASLTIAHRIAESCLDELRHGYSEMNSGFFWACQHHLPGTNAALIHLFSQFPVLDLCSWIDVRDFVCECFGS